MTGLVNWPEEAPLTHAGGLAVRLTQPSRDVVHIHTADERVWLANAHHFSHRAGPLLRTNYRYRALLGAVDDDPVGAAARAELRALARRLFVPCVGEFQVPGATAEVFWVRARWYRLCLDRHDGDGPAPVVDFPSGVAAAAIWHGPWRTDRRRIPLLHAARTTVTGHR